MKKAPAHSLYVLESTSVKVKYNHFDISHSNSGRLPVFTRVRHPGELQ